MSGEQPRRFGDYVPDSFVSFKEKKTHTVLYDPNGPMKEGRYGPMLQVLEDGSPAWLGVKSKNLTKQLKAITERCKVTITQSGSGFDTTYEVKVLGKK